MTAPAWRDFEKLVSRIEKALAGESVTVKSPDRIPCITTGTLREVDVSIRTRVGSAEILVTVECRRRDEAQDVTWIEQLVTKKKNIGAAKTIAVSASGFSAEASRIARENTIDLRILDEITEEDIKGWLPMVDQVIHVFKDCELTGTPAIFYVPESGDELTGEILTTAGSCDNATHPFFRGPNDEPLSLSDLWLRIDTQAKIFDKVPTDNKDFFITLEVQPADDLRVCTPRGDRRVKSIKLPLRLRWKHEFIPLADAKIVRYKAADSADPLPEQVVVEFATQGARTNNFKFGLHFQKGDAQVRLSAEQIPKSE